MSDKLDQLAALRRNRGSSTAGNARNSQRERIRLTNSLQTLSGTLAAVDGNGNPLSYCMGVQKTKSPANATGAQSIRLVRVNRTVVQILLIRVIVGYSLKRAVDEYVRSERTEKKIQKLLQYLSLRR